MFDQCCAHPWMCCFIPRCPSLGRRGALWLGRDPRAATAPRALLPPLAVLVQAECPRLSRKPSQTQKREASTSVLWEGDGKLASASCSVDVLLVSFPGQLALNPLFLQVTPGRLGFLSSPRLFFFLNFGTTAATIMMINSLISSPFLKKAQ